MDVEAAVGILWPIFDSFGAFTGRGFMFYKDLQQSIGADPQNVVPQSASRDPFYGSLSLL